MRETTELLISGSHDLEGYDTDRKPLFKKPGFHGSATATSLPAISVKSWTDGVRVRKPIFWLKVRPALRQENALHETARRK
ncbi:hypothetical protein KPH14_007550 [Odynerus spinipes]|uniref:Uncharacterized protein n=1 Tax=Odynerus spinipes TaxID=1348599 RepID=A0AAD9RHH1_9HYME|nr:hypothetical protein KPH14_007550 [Odynerus spinipes]